MVRQLVTDEQLETLARKQEILFQRVRENGLPIDWTLAAIQNMMGGRFPPADPVTTLVHGLFLDHRGQLRRVRQWNEEYGWGFTLSDFERAEAVAPNWPDKSLTTLVLVPYLGNAKKTFIHLWRVAGDHHRYSLGPDEQQISDIVAAEHPRDKCLRWEVIDLSSDDPRTDPTDRGVRGGAHAGVLAAAALHPEWLRAMDGDAVPFVLLRNYDITMYADGDPAQRRSYKPSLGYFPKDRKIVLHLSETGAWDTTTMRENGVAEPRLLSVASADAS